MAIEQRIVAYRSRVEQQQVPKPRVCRICGCVGRLRWHGLYRRTLITLAKTYILPIKRLFCALCRHTFALLPDFALKFHRYAVETIRFALKQLGWCTYEQVAEMFVGQDDRCLAPLTLHFWRRKFA